MAAKKSKPAQRAVTPSAIIGGAMRRGILHTAPPHVREAGEAGAAEIEADLKRGIKIYSDDVADEICHRVAMGETVRSIARDLGISPYTPYAWAWRRPEFKARLELARQAQAEVYAAEGVDLCEEAQRLIDSGNARRVDVRLLQLQVSTRQWIASKLLQHRYGDKVQQEQTGKVVFEIHTFADGAPAQQGGRLINGDIDDQVDK